MNLYRLDFTDGPLDGTPVIDVLGPVLLSSAERANAVALDEAVAQDHPVTITRISGGGSLRAIRRATPDGRIERVAR